MKKIKYLKEITEKPWGGFQDLAENSGQWHLKLLFVKKGQRLSLQQHKLRSELWIVLEGRAEAQKGKTLKRLAPKQFVFIEKGEVHRLKGLTDALVAEISFGKHQEADIKRLADDYGRLEE